MADIKTRDAVIGTIKAIDKSAVAAERMKDAFIRTKDEAQRGASSAEDSPEKYAADEVTSLAETAAFDRLNAAVLSILLNDAPDVYTMEGKRYADTIFHSLISVSYTHLTLPTN